MTIDWGVARRRAPSLSWKPICRSTRVVRCCMSRMLMLAFTSWTGACSARVGAGTRTFAKIDCHILYVGSIGQIT